MSETVGDFLVDRLRDWGVRRIFGYSGDGIQGVLAALQTATTPRGSRPRRRRWRSPTRYAELLGLRGVRVDDPDAVGPAWDEALAADRPTVIEARVDPDVPVLPPLFTAAQEKTLRKALRKGDAEAAGVERQLDRELAEGGVRRKE